MLRYKVLRCFVNSVHGIYFTDLVCVRQCDPLICYVLEYYEHIKYFGGGPSVAVSAPKVTLIVTIFSLHSSCTTMSTNPFLLNRLLIVLYSRLGGSVVCHFHH